MQLRNEAYNLPASEIAGLLNEKLAESQCAVVTAAPGAGKSTLLPLTVLESMPEGRILMLEPRRIAARQIAERMAWLLGEEVGQTVGYRIRFENRISSATRIEVITEGILTRMLADDPTLEGVCAVIFDEFHERSIHSDLALALTREAQSIIRPDLKIIIMSATIDTAAICKALSAPLIESEGRMFPIETVHLDLLPLDISALNPSDISDAVGRTILRAHREHEGDILAFLPGEAEIRRCQEALEPACPEGTAVYPLLGMQSAEEQRRAIAPSSPGERKIVLATPVAETSLTIEGVRIVVDSGLCRRQIYNPQNALSRLETVRISMDMADQRRGRAGRVAEGFCYRLWSPATEQRMAANRIPEILEADLCPMVLSIAAWGEGNVDSLQWLTPPPRDNVRNSMRLLSLLGCLDEDGRMTAKGRRLAALPCHPRIGSMLLSAAAGKDSEVRNDPEALKDSAAGLAADLAALLDEKDPLPREAGADICDRIAALRRAGRNGSWMRISRAAEQYRQLIQTSASKTSTSKGAAKTAAASFDNYQVGLLLAAAYPERIAKSQDGCGRYLLANGEQATLDPSDALCAYDWISIASMNSRPGAAGRIFLAAPLSAEDLSSIARTRDVVAWDSRKGCVTAQREKRIGVLLLEARQLSEGIREDAVRVICEAARKDGLSMLDFNDEVGNLQRRIAATASWRPETELPDISTKTLLDTAPSWLPDFIGKASSTAELKKIDLCAAIWSMLSYQQQHAVETYAPSHITVPTGSRIRLEYRLGAEAPVLRVRLQECFGMLDTPLIDGGRRPVLMELLSPGFKPVQLTSDLRSFWNGTYFEVRKELKRRYPKHLWPDNPLDFISLRKKQ